MDTSTARQSDKLDRSVIITGLVVVSGLIMVVLDTTIVNVALNSLSRELDAPLSTTQWVITGYLLAVALVIPLTGWVMDRFGPKATWLVSIGLFVAGSALCAAAWSIESLIAFRVIQGLGGGMLLPGGQAIIARAAGPNRLGRAMSIIGIPMLLGPVLGPVIGGVLVEYASWHWIFLVNVPVGILAIALAMWKLPAGGALPGAGRLDVLGLVVLSGSLVSLLYGLSQASAHGGFGQWGVLGWLIGGACGLAVYTWHSLRKGAASIIDVRLFTNRLFASGTVAVFLVAIALFGGMLLLPLYYQTVRGQGAMNAGLLLAPQGLGAMVAMVIAGRLTDRIGAGYVVPVGVVLAVLGTLPFTQLGVDTPYVWLCVALFVRGMGLGSVMMPTFAAAYSNLGHDAVSRAAPSLSAIQQVGASLGTALLVTALTQRLTGQLSAAGVESQGGGTNQLSNVSPEAMPVVGPLLADSFGFAFWVATALTALIIVPALFLPRHAARDRESVPAAPGI
ncbi:DHA2 family efflux MFS transporter permease subunit [Aldersonia sp. NBC_00410]|uniref:DHA2 family efflux MFS transporter permease subunit n=1 Tax=Aldersonia sp. NBC_00410 TaxID=2975954 RepID=UPI0022594AE0|nr:DHA2 family efflux MFS transporter permease subunit [Aldersonia sp. NBC_00410]MCX5046048.1 DHA2 family efflux MFS transporter permease subunit [Aldersonia sp. NBC_00410]